jgi:hypothetical protein
MKTSGHSGKAKDSGAGDRKRPSTKSQRGAHKRLATSARGWSDLTEQQRLNWRHRARAYRTRTRKGRSYPLEGQQFYNKICSVLDLCGKERPVEPPARAHFGPNPVAALRLTGYGPSFCLELVLKSAPQADIMVFGSPPRNAGRSFCADFRFLGLLPPPVNEVSEITRLYGKKFGWPPDNKRLFIRAWQMVDGWEDRPGMWQGSVLTPTPATAALARKAARPKGKKQ